MTSEYNIFSKRISKLLLFCCLSLLSYSYADLITDTTLDVSKNIHFAK